MDTNKQSSDSCLNSHIWIKPLVWNRHTSVRRSHNKEQPVRAARVSRESGPSSLPAAPGSG